MHSHPKKAISPGCASAPRRHPCAPLFGKSYARMDKLLIRLIYRAALEASG